MNYNKKLDVKALSRQEDNNGWVIINTKPCQSLEAYDFESVFMTFSSKI